MSTLRWRVAHASRCELEPDLGGVDPDEGSTLVSPARTTTYTLTCEELGADFETVESRDRAETVVTVVP